MSFILDALKKSENERQRQIGPSLADIPIRRARSERPWWAVAVAALLVINLGVLLVVLLRDRPSGTMATAAQPTAQPQASAPTNVVAPANPAPAPTPARANPAVQSLAEAASPRPDMMYDEPAYDRSMAGAAHVPAGPPVVRAITPPTVEPLPSPPAFASRERAENGSPSEEMLPTHGSLIASGTRLPDMRLDIHVYSQNPAERFVFVNMRKYAEGQTSSEGALIERITADGVILNQNGMRFLLPRQ